MRLFDESVEEHFLLLTIFVMVAMDTVENKCKTLIGWVEILDSLNLARKLNIANEFAEYCEIHAK